VTAAAHLDAQNNNLLNNIATSNPATSLRLLLTPVNYGASGVDSIRHSGSAAHALTQPRTPGETIVTTDVNGAAQLTYKASYYRYGGTVNPGAFAAQTSYLINYD